MKKKISEERDKELLATAIDLASQSVSKGGGPFGAVIARDGEIVAGAWNEVVYTSDPTAHAEVLAIRKACELLGNHSLDGYTIYASCEPCPMCLGAIYWAGIKRVVYAANRFDAANAGFSDEDIYRELNLDPSLRKIEFSRYPDTEFDEPFRLWRESESKTPY